MAIAKDFIRKKKLIEDWWLEMLTLACLAIFPAGLYFDRLL